jgi:hypothetical protein
MRGYIKRRPRRTTPPALTDDQRQELTVLLDKVPAGADESDSNFVTLIESWWALDPECHRTRAPSILLLLRKSTRM